MKNNKLLYVLLVLALVGGGIAWKSIGPEGTNGTLINPYDVYDETHRQRHMKAGALTDSIVVHNDATDYMRRIAPMQYWLDNSASGITVNNATVGLSKANLNSTYPNVPVGYRVMCPNIILGGAIYMKTTENGSSDVWQTISAPPTL